jgi:hypothetical protein
VKPLLSVVAGSLLVLACAADSHAFGVKIKGKRLALQVEPPPAPPPLPPAGEAPPPDVAPPPGVPLEIAPPGPPVPLPGPGPVLPPPGHGRPMTVKEFACSFRPACGSYELVLEHPYTHCPVKVCFRLPDGCPKVGHKKCIREKVEFDYGKHEVTLVFYRNGRVKVDYD